jgi:hypothetical protein
MLVGCSKGPTIAPPPPKEGRYPLLIGQAFSQAENKLKRPPKNVEEIMPYLKELNAPDDVLISPVDGQPYVIVFPEESGDWVIAYEKEGKDGQRWFVDITHDPQRVTNEVLAKKKFPPGHKFPG